MKEAKPMFTRKTWDEFRECGLIFLVNTILQAFGWSIFIAIDDKTGMVTDVFPARVRFRGFSNPENNEHRRKIADYLAENAHKFPEEIKDL